MSDAVRRTNDLKNELAKLKLEMRDDSSLCKEYIAGASKSSASEIAQEMALMNYLHGYTTYTSDLVKVKEYLVKQHGPFKGVWRHASQCTKLYITSTKEVPNIWPWLEE